MLLEAMQHVEQNRIIYLQDDYLLKGPTDAEALAQMLEAFAVLEADYLRIFPWPSATEPHPNYPNIGDLGVEQPYRTSLQAAIWRKSVLVNLLQAGESGHQFEERSPGRAATENYRFFGICDPDVSFATMNDRRYSIDYYATAIFQGKWLGDAIRVLAENRISIDPRPRGILNRWDYWLFTRTIGQSGARVSLLRLIDRCIFKQPIVNLTLTRLMMRDGKVSRWLAPVANENSMVTAER